MLQTYEGIIDQEGKLRLIDPVALPKSRRVIITILNEDADDSSLSLTLLSEASLAREWSQPEEDEAWQHLAQLPSL